jgi:hypothetical protein
MTGLEFAESRRFAARSLRPVSSQRPISRPFAKRRRRWGLETLPLVAPYNCYLARSVFMPAGLRRRSQAKSNSERADFVERVTP